MYTVVYVDARGNRDHYFAGNDNEFATEAEAKSAIEEFESVFGALDNGCSWVVEEVL